MKRALALAALVAILAGCPSAPRRGSVRLEGEYETEGAQEASQEDNDAAE